MRIVSEMSRQRHATLRSFFALDISVAVSRELQIHERIEILSWSCLAAGQCRSASWRPILLRCCARSIITDGGLFSGAGHYDDLPPEGIAGSLFSMSRMLKVALNAAFLAEAQSAKGE